MNPRHAITLAALVGLLTVSRADSILLSDNFSGASLDTSKWTTILPYGQSSVTQANGELKTQGRGILATVDGFNDPYIVNGSFTMLSDLEHFNIALRTDLSEFGPPFAERSGIIVTFVNDGNGVGIQQFLPNSIDWYQLDVLSYALVTGQTYFFSIFDDGANVSVSLNGTNVLSAATTFATGNKIAFYSREFGSTATSIDAINITHVPEVGVTALLLGVGLAGLGILNRAFPKRRNPV